MAKLDAGTAGTSMTAAETPRIKRVIFVLMGCLLSGTSSLGAHGGDFERCRDIPTNLYAPSVAGYIGPAGRPLGGSACNGALLVSAAICNGATHGVRCGTERPHP